MEFGILGPLEVREGSRDLAPRRAKERSLLATLLVSSNRVVSTDRLIDTLWGDSPPATASTALHGHVSALRKRLGQKRIDTVPPGYRLHVEPDELDLVRFERLFAQARATADSGKRASLLREAVALWRGEPLVDLRDVPEAQGEIGRLEALRLAALEERAETELELGRHAEVLPDLELLLSEHPLSEGLRGLLMLALYRSGRQSQALRVYHEGRRRLAEELGIEPGSALQALERQILAQDPTLVPVAPEQAGPRQERKLVTVLVAEISAAGPMDPEDLERVAGPALDGARSVIGHFGGTADRLFANALLGVFGAPRAHDDDAQRAVRAAMALRDAGVDPRLQLRVGIESGEALVTIHGTEVAITGDVLTTASHLQATGPPGSILVGDATYRATVEGITYREARDGSWSAEALRPPTATATPEAPFVGRVDELALLERTYARARNERSVQLVTVAAEPGGGKSRLVREFRTALDATGEPHAWRQGRCLPYGEGVTYWALGEIVKAQAGILESDDTEASVRKLGSALSALDIAVERRPWLERGIGALLGIEGATASADREQAFAAWRQLFEAIAAREPLVVVFEDIHWADVALLEFIDHVVGRASGVPIVVLCTARLELLDAHPDWAGGKRNAATLALAPLSDVETEQVLRALLGRSPTSKTIKRAGGNPLFARELALTLNRLGSEDATAVPGSLQGVISARLDALPPELKSLAHDAAVVGEVFWSGALAAMSGLDDRVVEERLDRLVANDVARRQRSSSVARQTEYSFLHVLVRDVAYGQIPRRERGSKHQAAADWIEGLAGDRTIDHAEFLAYHTLAALELLGSISRPDAAAALRVRSSRFLVLAGDRAMRLDVAAAERFYERALELLEPGHEDRPAALVRVADAAQEGGRLREAVGRYEEALVALQPVGDPLEVARAMNGLARVLWRLGETKRHEAVLDDAIGRLAALPDGPEKTRLWGLKARCLVLAGRSAEAQPWIERALAAAETSRVPEVRVRMLMYRELARQDLGAPISFDDSREAIRLGHELGLGYETAVAYTNLASGIAAEEGSTAALEIVEHAIEFSEQRSLGYMIAMARWGISLSLRVQLGEWDEALADARAFLAAGPDKAATQLGVSLREVCADVLVSRGLVDEAEPVLREQLPAARHIGDLQALVPTLAIGARFELLRGDQPAALGLVRELEAVTRSNPFWRTYAIADAVRVCVAGSDLGLADRLLSATISTPRRNLGMSLGARAALAEARGHPDRALRLHTEAADLWGRFGYVLEQGRAVLGRGRSLALLGRPAEALDALVAAQVTFARLGARPLLDETEGWLQRLSRDGRDARGGRAS